MDAPHTDQPADPGAAQALRSLYALFYNKVFGIGIILAMAVATLLGTLLQQAPDWVVRDPALYAQWLDTVRAGYGGWTPILSALGLFTVFSSWWFRLLAVLLGLSIIACTTHRLPQLWARATKPHLHVSGALFEQARYRSSVATALEPAAALDRVREELGRRHYRVVADDRDAASLYADRFRWMPFGTVIAHTGFVVILLGVLVSSLFGLTIDSLKVTVGQRVPVGRDTGLSVEAASFTDSYYADGRPKDYAADLVVYRGEERVAGQTVRVNSPLTVDGISFHQASFGIAGVITLRDASGATVFSGGIPLTNRSADGSTVSGFTSTGRGEEVVYAETAASGAQSSAYRPGQLLVEVYPSRSAAKPSAAQLLTQGRPAQAGELTATFEREAAFTDLMVKRDPGVGWVYLGSLLTAIGTIMTMMLKHRRVWARVRPAAGGGAEILLASPERHDTVFERWFTGLVNDLYAGAPARGKDHDRG